MTDADDTTDFLSATRAFYDTVAADYADHFPDDLSGRPLERALLAAFAELVGAGGAVADLGCGPGRLTAHLAGLGLDAFGVDLSESMLSVARREHPELRYERGSMLDLDLPDGGLAGVVSWYSIIHTPVERLPGLLGEFHRVLAPGGQLLLAFQAGNEPLRLERPWGHPVTLDFHRRQPGHVAELLADAGFRVGSRTVREADERLGESTPQALLLARKQA